MPRQWGLSGRGATTPSPRSQCESPRDERRPLEGSGHDRSVHHAHDGSDGDEHNQIPHTLWLRRRGAHAVAHFWREGAMWCQVACSIGHRRPITSQRHRAVERHKTRMRTRCARRLSIPPHFAARVRCPTKLNNCLFSTGAPACTGPGRHHRGEHPTAKVPTDFAK